VPYWDEVIRLSRRVSQAVGLGYIGVDVVIDATHGPMLLEANARPGLAIQIANGQGLAPRLEEIDDRLARGPAPRILPMAEPVVRHEERAAA
jgi:glutathione synthase/RimK-type ligase-like ATP-grasp enzyme